MAEKVKVALSPFFGNKEGFLDEVSGVHFTLGQRGELVTYDISKVTKLEGIKRAIRLNVLFLIEGSLDLVQEEVKVEEPEKAEEVSAELVEVKLEEKPLEEVTVKVEEPKAKYHPKKK